MAEKLGGGTLVRVPRMHTCTVPNIPGNQIIPGDRWTCGDCGTCWVCKPGFDQREPDPYWERLR